MERRLVISFHLQKIECKKILVCKRSRQHAASLAASPKKHFVAAATVAEKVVTTVSKSNTTN